MRFLTGAAVLVLCFTSVTSAFSQSSSSKPDPPPPHPCDADPNYHKLDFWVGAWDVYDNHDSTLNGTDVVEKIVGGCAIIENWREADGSGEGKSLFYYLRAKKTMEAGVGNRRWTD
jgi:hypothetical protein